MNTTTNQITEIRNLTNEEIDAVTGAMIHQDNGYTQCTIYNNWELWMADNFGICVRDVG